MRPYRNVAVFQNITLHRAAKIRLAFHFVERKNEFLTDCVCYLTFQTSPTCATSGVPGVPGVPGLNGRDGARGDRGPVGPSGKTGPQGLEEAKGAKGDQAQAPLRNWKQCAWKNLNDGRDYGLIKVRLNILSVTDFVNTDAQSKKPSHKTRRHFRSLYPSCSFYRRSLRARSLNLLSRDEI